MNHRTVDRFKRFLRRDWPAPRPVRIIVKWRCTVVSSVDINRQVRVGFGLYISQPPPVIYVGGHTPRTMGFKDMVISTIAHEYRHHLQRCLGRPYDEDDADRFAEEAVRYFRRKI